MPTGSRLVRLALPLGLSECWQAASRSPGKTLRVLLWGQAHEDRPGDAGPGGRPCKGPAPPGEAPPSANQTHGAPAPSAPAL